MSEQMKYPGVGSGVWIRKEGKVLLGKRIGNAGGGSWCPPGGKIEMYEDLIENACRETREETGLEIRNVQFSTFASNPMKEIGKHYVTLYFIADWKSGEAKVMEPEKCEEWGWFSWDMLPSPLFQPTRIFVEKGYNPFKF